MPKFISIGGNWKKVIKPVEITIEDKPVVIEEVKEEVLDLNKDGKVDTKDASIASKVMNAVKKSKKVKSVRRKK